MRKNYQGISYVYVPYNICLYRTLAVKIKQNLFHSLTLEGGSFKWGKESLLGNIR